MTNKIQKLKNLRLEKNKLIEQQTTQNKFDKNYYFGGVYPSDDNYDKFLNWEKIAKDLIKRFKFNSFLDIGCGCGNLVKEIKKQLKNKEEKIFNIHGIDISEFAIKKANVPFVTLADCKSLPFENKSFDITHILGTFAYLPKLSEIKQAIKDAYRVSKKIIIFDEVYVAPNKKNSDYDPYRKHVFSQKKWLILWKEVVSKNDTIKTYKDEIIINKNYYATSLLNTISNFDFK